MNAVYMYMYVLVIRCLRYVNGDTIFEPRDVGRLAGLVSTVGGAEQLDGAAL